MIKSEVGIGRVRPGILLALLACTMSGEATAQNCRVGGLDSEAYRRVLQEQFSGLYSARPGNVPGTYAALDLKDAEATFANTAVFTSGALLHLKARGAVAEGLLPILDNQKVNGKLGLDVRLHRLGKAGSALRYSDQSCDLYYEAIRKAVSEDALGKVEIRENYLETLRQVEVDRLQRHEAELEKLIGAATLPARRDSLLVERTKVQVQMQQVTERPLPPDSLQYDRLRKRTASARRAARSILKVYGFKVGWWSLGYGLSSTAFRLLDATAPFAEQLTKKTSLSHSVNLSYSLYDLTPAAGESRFLSIGVSAGLTDNLASLRAVELTEKKEHGRNPGDRTAVAKYTAYEGEYERRLATATLSADYYSFLLLRNQGALHLYPAVTFTKGMRPTYATGVGFLVVARKDDKSVINAELYFNLTDLTNVTEAKNSFIGRSGLGLRFTFPITFGATG